jgi:hypothetical protein
MKDIKVGIKRLMGREREHGMQCFTTLGSPEDVIVDKKAATVCVLGTTLTTPGSWLVATLEARMETHQGWERGSFPRWVMID